jgi:hypothetical protein
MKEKLMSQHLTDDQRRALQNALAKHGMRYRQTSGTSDGFIFRGTYYAQPAMKRLMKADFEGFCSLAGSDFTAIRPVRDGQRLTGVELEGSLNAYKATWHMAIEGS